MRNPTRVVRVAAALAALAALAAAPVRASEESATSPPLVNERVLEAPLEAVWEVFTTAEGWKVFGVAQASVDLRVGGKILTRYAPGGTLGDEQTIENTVLALEPHRMLAIRATKAPAGFPYPPEVLARTWSVFTFAPLGDGRTRVTIRGHGYGTDDASRRMRAFFEQGNEWTMSRVTAHFAKTAPPRDESLAPVEATTLVEAPQSEVFRAWSTAAGIEGFLGARARVELVPGGPYEIEFDASKPKGKRGSEGCTVLGWLPGRMLSFTWNAPPEFPRARAERTVVVVELETEAPGVTRVRLTNHGFAERAAAAPAHAEEWRKVRAYFAEAWPSVLEALRSSL